MHHYKLSPREKVLIGILSVATIILNIPIKHFDPELAPYQQEFLYKANNCPKRLFYPSKQWIIFSDKLEPEVAAVCLRAPGWFSIKVNTGVWEQLTPEEKYELMVHEMAHCYLGLDHKDKDGYYLNPMIQGKLSRATVDKQVDEDIATECTE